MELFETTIRGNVITGINKVFQKILKKIEKELDVSKGMQKNLTLEKEIAPMRIKDYGPAFGVKLKPKEIILEKWLFTLPEREKKNILQMILVREAFRCCLEGEIPIPECYIFFVDVLLNIIATAWLAHTFRYSYCHPTIIDIRGRIVFDDNDSMKNNNWEWFLIDCIKYDLSIKKIFNHLVNVIQDNREKKCSLKEVARNFEKWYERQRDEYSFSMLPLKLTPKNFQIIRALVDLGAIKASAKKVGEMINKSYNSINRNFIKLTNNLSIYWRAEVNNPLLRLYSYRFEVQVLKESSLNTIIKRFRTLPYIREIDLNNQDFHKIILAGLLESPLVVKNNLQYFFERLQRKGKIGDFFIEEIRRKKIFCAVTTQSFPKKLDSVHSLLESASSMNDLVVLNILDKQFNYLLEKREKKNLILDEKLLTFLALIRARYLGKAHYMLANLTEFYQLAKKNNINTTDSRSIKDFTNQLEIRSRRLGLLEYYLNIQSLGNFSHYLYLRISARPSKKKLQEFIQVVKILSGSGLIVLELSNSLLLQFPKIKIDSFLCGILEEMLTELDVNFSLQEMNYYKGYVPSLSLEYHKYYDFKTKRWKI